MQIRAEAALIAVIVTGIIAFAFGKADSDDPPLTNRQKAVLQRLKKEGRIKEENGVIRVDGTQKNEDERPKIGAQWNYHSSTDKMNDRKTYYASVRSINGEVFDFPYRGEQRGTLTLRTHPRYGKSIIFMIDDGQILCRYRGCDVLVKFDDAAPVRYAASEPSDDRNDVLFIQGYAGFVSQMMKAKTARVEVEFFREGSRVFEFDVRGFDANRYLDRKSDKPAKAASAN